MAVPPEKSGTMNTHIQEGRAERSELCPGVDRSYFRGFGWTGTLHIVAAKLLDLNSTMSVACLSRGLKK